MSHYSSSGNIDLARSRHNGSLPNLLSYGNGGLNGDEYEERYVDSKYDNGPYTNGYVQNGHEPTESLVIVLELGDNERRFGFSVVGGVDEGFRPRIDEVIEGLPAARKGVRVGDEIEKVNEKSVRYSTHAQIVTTIHESVGRGQITLTLIRKNVRTMLSDNTNSLPERGRLGNRNNSTPEVHANLSDKTREKLEVILRHPNRHLPTQTTAQMSSHENIPMSTFGNRRRGGLESSQNRRSPNGSYTSGSTLSLNHQSGSNTSPVRTVDPPFMGVDNYGYQWRQSHYSVSAPAYNEAIHGPSQTSYLSSVGSDDTAVPMMDSKDCQAVISALMRHAVTEDDEQMLDDLRILESSLHTRHFRNAFKVMCKIVELENQGRGPHFESAHREDAAGIRSQILNFLGNQVVISREARELGQILDSLHMRELLMAHDRAAKIDRPNFAEGDNMPAFERADSSRVSSDRISTDRMSNDDDDQVKIVKIEKSDEPLGATVRNEGTAVVIGRIVNGGAAQKSGLLREGDEIIEINGVDMRGKTVEEVVELLADMTGTLTFFLKPSSKTQQNLFTSAELHVRALFDYDPNDDEFIPCRELGLGFSRRDILHIVNQDDADWWQAWREGTSGNELAGLIPGKNFQKQREELKSRAKQEKKRKTTTCGCFGKSKGRKALMSSSSEDEFEALTYEEVGLLQPDKRHKRPIVLIGPTKIGRRELRQRLLQVAPERFGSAIAHTSRRQEPGEVNGKEYHFITKHHFKDLVASGKFVEHGEYDGQSYGTSVDAIKEVVGSGKVCVVNLHCQALKVLRESKLKPFVVFICPPTVEKIKRLRRGNIDPFNPAARISSDEELQEIVDSAQEMEDDYGHYFDKIIVNTDLERTFDELIKAINELETRPQWVPIRWIRQT